MAIASICWALRMLLNAGMPPPPFRSWRLTVASFGLADLVLNGAAAAVAGLALYVLALATLRPRGLVDAWRYVRALHA